jgi:hypothetical protein
MKEQITYYRPRRLHLENLDFDIEPLSNEMALMRSKNERRIAVYYTNDVPTSIYRLGKYPANACVEDRERSRGSCSSPRGHGNAQQRGHHQRRVHDLLEP